jgi:hypothetical protein
MKKKDKKMSDDHEPMFESLEEGLEKTVIGFDTDTSMQVLKDLVDAVEQLDEEERIEWSMSVASRMERLITKAKFMLELYEVAKKNAPKIWAPPFEAESAAKDTAADPGYDLKVFFVDPVQPEDKGTGSPPPRPEGPYEIGATDDPGT